jgi:hypothetical protein
MFWRHKNSFLRRGKAEPRENSIFLDFRVTKLTSEVGITPNRWDKKDVKIMSKVVEKKTAGTFIVEKYRSRLNKLTPAQRRRLRDQAMRIAFGHESESAPGSRK